jgi:myosin protein heavy chain
MEVADKDKQLRIMTDQTSELLRLLESEESVTAQLQGEVAELRAELDEIRQKYSALLTTAKTHEELATKAAREGQLRAEEIRLLRVEVEQLKQQNTELKMKTQIEVEALQEQLRVRKEKQYQILEKLQAQEEAQRQAQDQVAGMEEQLRALHARNLDLETQNKVESRSKNNIEEANKELQVENTNLFNQNKELQTKIERSERERLRMEAEARDSGEKLRQTAENVFQLLERLKLAELGKTKAMDALKKKEQDLVALQKKNARLIQEAAEEGKARVKAEMDNKVLQEQVRALKKNNTSLAQKAKDEATGRSKAVEERDALDEKLKTMEARLSFLLNKVQSDEETRLVQAEERKKLEQQVLSAAERQQELQQRVSELAESNRVVTQALRLKQDELNALENKHDHLLRELQQREADLQALTADTGTANNAAAATMADGSAPDDIDNVRLNEGRGRFYVEAKSVGGGSLLLLKARKPTYRDWLDKHSANDFLKKAQKTTRFRDLVVEKFAAVYGLLMVEEEEKEQLLAQVAQRDVHIAAQQRKLAYLQDTLAVEEDAKRRMLLRYIHAVKEHAMDQTSGGGVGGVLQLPESNLGDEEIHALSALLRNNSSIEEVNLRNNLVTDDGVRALAAVLSSNKSALKLIDLRGNRVSRAGVKLLAEALERCDRVRHVYVHAGGKIEALGTSWAASQVWAHPRDGGAAQTAASNSNNNVETICVVDVRDNNPEAAAATAALLGVDELAAVAATGPAASSSSSSSSNNNNNNSSSNFQPRQLLATQSLGNVKAPQRAVSPGKDQSRTPLRTKDKEKKRALESANATTSSSATSGPQSLVREYEEQLVKLREAGWHGRSEGLDISRSLQPPLLLLDASLDVSKSTALRKKKNAAPRGTTLPPLTHSSSGVTGGESRPTTATRLPETFGVDVERSAEALLQADNNAEEGGIEESEDDGAGGDARQLKKKKKKTRRVSETEKRLMAR